MQGKEISTRKGFLGTPPDDVNVIPRMTAVRWHRGQSVPTRVKQKVLEEISSNTI